MDTSIGKVEAEPDSQELGTLLPGWSIAKLWPSLKVTAGHWKRVVSIAFSFVQEIVWSILWKPTIFRDCHKHIFFGCVSSRR